MSPLQVYLKWSWDRVQYALDLLGHKTCLGACLQAKVFVPDLNGNPPLKYRVGHTHLEKPLLEDIQAAAL